MEIFIQVVGWVGAILVLLAFYLVSNNKISSQSLYYQLMNFFGSVFVGINVFYLAAWPSLGIQVVWGTIAFLAIGKLLRKS